MEIHKITINNCDITWKRSIVSPETIYWSTEIDSGILTIEEDNTMDVQEEVLRLLRKDNKIPKDTEYNYSGAEDDDDEIETFYNDPEDNPEIFKRIQEANKNKIDFHGDFDSMNKDTQNKILNPKHYKIFPAGTYHNGIEYTDLCVALFEKNGLDSYTNHLLGQAIKYITRVGQKDAASQDLGKATWYLTEAKAFLEKEGRYSENNFTNINSNPEGN